MTRPLGRIARLRRRWQLAGQLANNERSGRVLISVPAWLAAEAQAWIYVRRIEHASEKWAQRTAEVPLWAWQASMHEKGEQRWGSDQAGSNSDGPTGGP